jgi:PAS domain S-box-containing protein
MYATAHSHPAAPPNAQVVLLVEDEPGDAHLIRLQLQELKDDRYQLHHADSMAQARRMVEVEGFRPDVVLLDLNLPDSTGVATVALCRALIDAPVIVLTGLDDEYARQAAIQSGAEDYLTKGGSALELHKALRYAMLRYARDTDARRATAVFMHSYDGIIVTDAQGIIIEVNPALCRITGYSAAELLGNSPRLLASGQHDQQFYAAMWRDILGKDVWQGELVNRHKDGHLYFVGGSITVCRNAAGRIQQFICVMSDITERHAAQTNLQRINNRLQSILDNIPVGLSVFDADLKLVAKNQLFQTNLDLPDALFEDNAATFERLIRFNVDRGEYGPGQPDDQVAEKMTLVQQWHAHQFKRTRPNGLVLDIRGAPMPDGGFITTYADITDLVRANEEAQAANLAKSRFLATMSHEIRTPMNGILGMAQLLIQPNLSERDRLEYAHTVLGSGQSLLSLLNDILDLSKIEAGHFVMDLSPVDPAHLLQETQSLFSGAAKNKGLRLEWQWLGAPGQSYQSDSHRLRQMLSNLVGNAIKFTPSGHILIEAREISRSDNTATLAFSVTDSGIGIAPEKQAGLFQAFSQADSSTTREFGGSGLGLSIVSRLAQLLGGSVGVQSTLGQGARFWFQVQVGLIAQTSPLATPAAAPPPSATAQQHFSGRVLVAEDNPVNCMVIEGLLGTLGLEVELVDNGQQAVDALARANALDLVLMDLHMPVMDGYEATQRIRQAEQVSGRTRIPIIALTADAFEDDRIHCQAVGMDGFLTKPIALEALQQALTDWLKPAEVPAAAMLQPADAALAVAASEHPSLAALLSETNALLAQHKFDAIDCFATLQTAAANTALADKLAGIAPLVKSLRFVEALALLQHLSDVP